MFRADRVEDIRFQKTANIRKTKRLFPEISYNPWNVNICQVLDLRRKVLSNLSEVVPA